ncbi:MAG: hypothetical protein K8S99_03635 [Planctomycetes bacterium]|nr:hypothetical protein [Planctomycetota bacterium]
MEETTIDLCEMDFPPASYGKTLAQAEATAQQVVERIFRDEDDILRSGVYGKTMKPLRLEDVPCGHAGLMTLVRAKAIPPQFQPVWLNYENTMQASGKYLIALCEKYKATNSPQTRDLARRLVAAVAKLWKNAAAQHPYGRGWMPKPYGGIRDVSEMYETSADQYADLTFGLHQYWRDLADEEERNLIQEMILSFAAWWYDHDYSGGYLGRGIWWKRLPYPHPTGYFLFLNALAYSWDPCRKYQDGFETWLEKRDALIPKVEHNGSSGCGIALDAIDRLLELRPMERHYWMKAARAAADAVVWTIDTGNLQGPYSSAIIEPFGYSAHELSVAHRLMPERGYDKQTLRCLRSSTDRARFYHIARGQPTAGRDCMTDDYRNTFWCEGHAGWLAGYWALKNAGVQVE